MRRDKSFFENIWVCVPLFLWRSLPPPNPITSWLPGLLSGFPTTRSDDWFETNLGSRSTPLCTAVCCVWAPRVEFFYISKALQLDTNTGEGIFYFPAVLWSTDFSWSNFWCCGSLPSQVARLPGQSRALRRALRMGHRKSGE